ncbi:MAG: Fur family transcriptional regulator [Acidimicrobiales bacterium]
MKTPDELSSLFRTNGRKVTPQRQSIFRALQGNDSHPSAEAVYDAVRTEMETISLKTVYQTLNDLAELGEISILDVGRGAARFDPNATTHHHLVCDSCGQVRDLEANFSSPMVPSGDLQGFEISEAEVVFRGMCRECATARSDSQVRFDNQEESDGRARAKNDKNQSRVKEMTNG